MSDAGINPYETYAPDAPPGSAPPEARPDFIEPPPQQTALPQDQEEQFQEDIRNRPGYKEWYDSFKSRYGEEPNLEPGGDFDYRKAWLNGIVPQPYAFDNNFPHWPSTTLEGEPLKSQDHPTHWMQDYMTATGRDPNEVAAERGVDVSVIKQQFEATPPPDPQTQARAAGYSWDEINDHIATSTATALAHGYTGREIDDFLGYKDPQPFEDRARASWLGAMAADPKLLDTIEPASAPTVYSDYASALLNNEVKGPDDFAYRYAASALDAAGASGLDEVTQERQAGAVAQGAQALADRLPTREDLIDAVLSLAPGQITDQDQIRSNLMDHWLATGQDPARAAMQAQYDAGLSDQLTAPPPLPEPSFWERYATLTSPETDVQAYETMGNLVVNHFKGIIKDALDWGQAQQAIADRMEGKPLAEWVRDPQAMETAYSAAFAMMSANLEGSLASFIRRMRQPKIPVTDLAKPPGEAIGNAPITEAIKPVEPAKFEHEVEPVSETAAPVPSKFTADSTPAQRIERIAQDAEEETRLTPAVRVDGKIYTGLTHGDAYEDALRAHGGIDPGSRASDRNLFVTSDGRVLSFAEATAARAERVASPNFFEAKLAEMGETDPLTIALGKANDATARFVKWISDVFHDESGAGPGFPRGTTEVEPGTYRARVVGKNYAEDLVRRISTGLGTQRSEHIAQGFEQFFKDLSPFMPRFRQEMAKPLGGAWADTEIGRVLRAAEGDGVLAADHTAAPYIAWRAEQNQSLVADIEAAVARGDLNSFQAREFYLAHMYTPESVGGRGVTGGGRTGSAGWTRERTLPTYADAFAEGYKPLYDNPILIDIASMDAHYKLLDTVKMQGIAREANMMRYYQSSSEAARDNFKPLTGVNSEKIASTVDKEGNPGPPVVQRLYGANGFDKIWNNWVNFQNLNRSELATTIEDGLLKMKNLSSQAKLLIPGYHTVTEFKLGMSNAVADAITEVQFGLRHGNLGELARGMRDFVTSPLATPYNIAKSAIKWRPMYRAMEADPALDAFVGGGGGIGSRGKVYSSTDSPGIWKLWKRGQLFQETVAEVRRDFTFPNTRAGDGKWGVAGGLASDVTNLATLPLRAAAYGVQNLSAPIWDHMIPLLKSGAAMKRIETFIRQNPKASDDMVRNYAQTVVRNIEDRFGEYNPANLFWNPTLKRIANQSMLSTGWTYGTVHATMEALRMGRGFAWNPVATTNLMGQFATIAFTNAAWTLAIDGKMPSSTLDYIIPFANARGLARILLPGEEKEYYDWLKIVGDTYGAYNAHGVLAGAQQLWQSTVGYGIGKLAPIWQAALTWSTGVDRIGHHIADQPGGILKFLEQSFAPIFFENWDKAKAIGLNVVENLLGFREAPKQLNDFWGYVGNQQKLHDRWTKEELQRAGKEAIAVGQAPPEGYKPPGSSRGGGGGAANRAAAAANPGVYNAGLYGAPSQGGGYAPDTSGAVPVYRGGAGRVSAPRIRRAGRPMNLLPRSQRRLRGRRV